MDFSFRNEVRLRPHFLNISELRKPRECLMNDVRCIGTSSRGLSAGSTKRLLAPADKPQDDALKDLKKDLKNGYDFI